MPLSSLHFIFLFLPVFLALYYILPFGLWRNVILLTGSLFFFGWADPRNLPLFLLIILLDYISGRIIGSELGKGNRHSAKTTMLISVGINLLALVFYKYTGFLMGIFSGMSGITLDYEPNPLPLGISFFTFAGISYLLDIYNTAEKAEKNLLTFGAYLSMFPKLLQGPIARFGQVRNELVNPPRLNAGDLSEGARRFIAGLSRKVLLADPLGVATDTIFSADFSLLSGSAAWFGLLAYTLQILLDFSGYTDMAIGIGRMLGFKLPENFNYPYISRSITDFWRRWHMTLTAWFRTYLFIPLEFARKRQKFMRQQSNILIVFMLTGLWHGANWNFIIWGVYFGVILALEASGLGILLTKLPVFLQPIYALAVIMLGWVFFRIENTADWAPFISALFGSNGGQAEVTLRSLNIIFYVPILVLAALFSTRLFSYVANLVQSKLKWGMIGVDIIYLLLFILSISAILAKGFTVFLYAQF